MLMFARRVRVANIIRAGVFHELLEARAYLSSARSLHVAPGAQVRHTNSNKDALKAK